MIDHLVPTSGTELLASCVLTLLSVSAGKGYPCNTCNIVLNSIEQYQAHISGFKHKNQ